MDLTEDQWELYSKKYTKLMWKIAHRISGDSMTASIEDNYSDLCIAALESINGFHKKTSMDFAGMMRSKLFDQYTKTCLWTAKARKGIKLTERMPFRNRHVSIDEMKDNENSGFDIEDVSSISRYSRIEAEDMYEAYTEDAKNLINLLDNTPDLMTEKGHIKIYPVAKALGISAEKVKKIIKYTEVMNDSN